MIHRLFLICLVAFCFSADASADVSLTFDSDLEGFVQNGDATDLSWSSFNGGSMRITAAGGWAGNSSQKNLGGTAFFDELVNATINGGTISYDMIVVEAEQTYGTAPQWFESVMILNSAGGWDQDVISHGIFDSSWPLAGGTFTDTKTLTISGIAGTGNDGVKYADTSGFWSNLHFGLNNEGGGAVSEAVIYIDNITISANNPVPEPSALGLLGLAALGLVRRKR